MTQSRKTFSRRRVLQGSAALTAGAAMSGLGFNVARAQNADTVRVLSVEDPFFFALKEVLPDFEAQTGIKAELESLSYDAMQARLVSSFVSGTSDADVITIDQMWNAQYVDNGWVRTLNDLAARDKDDLDIGDFIPQTLHTQSTWRGQLMSLPVAAYAQGVMYRTDVFEQFGLSLPEGADWTWENYVGILQEIHGRDFNGTQMHGTVVSAQQPVPLVHMVSGLSASHGVRWFKDFPDVTPWDFTPTINSPEMLQSVELFRTLAELAPPESINYNWFDAGTRFSTGAGDIGMFYWWTPYFYLIKNDGYMSAVKSTVIDDYAVAPLPTAGATPQTVSIGGWAFGIPTSSEKVDAAWEFLKWSSSAETQKKMGLVDKFNFQFSDFARQSLYDDSDLKGIYPYLDAQRQMFADGNGKIARPPAPVYTTLEGILGLELNKVLIGQQTPQEALEAVDALFTNVLKGNFLMPYSLESFADTQAATDALIKELA